MDFLILHIPTPLILPTPLIIALFCSSIPTSLFIFLVFIYSVLYFMVCFNIII